MDCVGHRIQEAWAERSAGETGLGPRKAAKLQDLKHLVKNFISVDGYNACTALHLHKLPKSDYEKDYPRHGQPGFKKVNHQAL